ncbi:MAG: hypothetical protein COB30_015320 [Ectothiorhodospiraceae bacterium]|nr:hypothetical protein [Ectothiorhodospiraceae bacterium]
MGSRSKSTSITNETTIDDRDVLDLSNSDGSTAYNIGDISESNITVTDQGAVKAAFAALDDSIDAIRENSNAAISAQSNSNRASLAAVTEFGRPDAGLTSNPVLLIVVAALGLGAIFMLRGKG